MLLRISKVACTLSQYKDLTIYVFLSMGKSKITNLT